MDIELKYRQKPNGDSSQEAVGCLCVLILPSKIQKTAQMVEAFFIMALKPLDKNQFSAILHLQHRSTDNLPQRKQKKSS